MYAAMDQRQLASKALAMAAQHLVNLNRFKEATKLYSSTRELNAHRPPMEPLRQSFQNQKEQNRLLFQTSKGRAVTAKETTERMAELIRNGADVDAKDFVGNSFLHIAVQDRPELVDAVLAHKPHVNALNESGQTPLHLACLRHSASIVNRLLAHGANVNAQDDKGQTPLHITKNNEVLHALISHGAKLNVKDHLGCTPLFYAYLSQAKLLIAAGASLVFLNAKKQSLLFGQDPHVAELAISRSPDLLNLQDMDGNTALHFRASAGNVPAVEALLKRGADATLLNKNGETVLQRAINHISSTVYVNDIKRLAKLCDINNQNINGSTALHLAVRSHNDLEWSRALLEWGADPNIQNKQGDIPLQTAIKDQCEKLPLLELLASKSNMDHMNVDGQTAMDLAKATYPKTWTNALQKWVPSRRSVRVAMQGVLRRASAPVGKKK